MLGSIGDMLNQTLIPAILQAHEGAQQQLNTLGDALGLCVSPQQSQAVNTSTNTKSASLTAHSVCRSHESTAQTESATCDSTLATLLSAKTTSCNAQTNFENQQIDPNTCNPSGASDYSTWVNGVAVHFTDLQAQHAALKEGCDNATTAHDTLQPECTTKAATYTNKKTECDSKQTLAEQAVCAWATAVTTACTTYEECWDPAFAAYNASLPNITAMESDRKITWRVLKRI